MGPRSGFDSSCQALGQAPVSTEPSSLSQSVFVSIEEGRGQALSKIYLKEKKKKKKHGSQSTSGKKETHLLPESSKSDYTGTIT